MVKSFIKSRFSFVSLAVSFLACSGRVVPAVPGVDVRSDSQGESMEAWNPTKRWPILVSSLVFALLHLGQGGAPIPLFFLAVGLGFLYQRTGRLTPCIVVHMLLNGTMLLLEFSKIGAGVE